ncbi:hypothetical protein YC2023_102158 [Brassica napus]
MNIYLYHKSSCCNLEMAKYDECIKDCDKAVEKVYGEDGKKVSKDCELVIESYIKPLRSTAT